MQDRLSNEKTLNANIVICTPQYTHSAVKLSIYNTTVLEIFFRYDDINGKSFACAGGAFANLMVGYIRCKSFIENCISCCIGDKPRLDGT